MKITDTPAEPRRKLTKEEHEAAQRGDVAFLKEKLSSQKDFLVSQTPTGGNILHLLMQSYFFDGIDEVIEFIEQVIQKVHSLITQQDCNGNTPLHLLAEETYSYTFENRIDDLLLMMVREEAWEWDDAKVRPQSSPCGIKNVKGDTPLHVAVRDGNYGFAIKLLALDKWVAGSVNNRNQNPLHLLSIPFDSYLDDDVDKLLRCLTNGNADLVYMQDEDGLTPLLTAVRGRNSHTVQKLCEHFPYCTEIADFKGRTLWHWFGSRRLERDVTSAGDFDGLMGETWNFLAYQNVSGRIRSLMASKDKDGNTPLHLAIQNQQFDFALFILDNWRVDLSVKQEYEELLAIENKDGVSSYTLIGSADHLPLEFEKSLFKNGNLLYGHRSSYGVPTTKIEEYANTIGVIAALLATITFTAAFTVPGGLDSSKGTPLLLGNAEFQVFMVADVVAMCTSVMVLFCLLWIMTTGHKKESLLLLDVSVFLLQTSFHATLVTFMTGLYVTTIPIVPAIAISTCVVCTLLIILMHKRLVMLTVVPFFGKLIILGRKIR